ncbi:MAG: GYD domain-containing protein [Candidatus Heimdallarchaeota archaeon]
MPVFIILGQYTHEGVTKIKDSPQRLEAARKVAETIGGEIKQFFYTMGQYDFVAVCEAPSAEAMMKALMIIGSAGAIKTESLIAIPESDAVGFIRELP